MEWMLFIYPLYLVFEEKDMLQDLKPQTTYELPTCRLHDNPKLLMIVCVCAVDKTASLPRVPSITVDGALGLDLQIFY